MAEIIFEIPIPPVAKERARYSKFGAYTPKRTKEFENAVRSYARQYYLDGLLNQPLKVFVEFHLSKPRKPKFELWPAVRPDIDNFQKSLFDSLNKMIWEDDCLICDLHVKKVYAIDRPKIVVKIEGL